MKPDHKFAKDLALLINLAEALGQGVTMRGLNGRQARLEFENLFEPDKPAIPNNHLKYLWRRLTGNETDGNIFEGSAD